MSDSSGRSTLIGVAISLAGNILISLALNCQKLAHVRLEQEGDNGDEESQRLLQPARANGETAGSYGSGVAASSSGDAAARSPRTTKPPGGQDSEGMSTKFLRSRLWWVGISLMVLGEFGNFLCE